MYNFLLSIGNALVWNITKQRVYWLEKLVTLVYNPLSRQNQRCNGTHSIHLTTETTPRAAAPEKWKYAPYRFNYSFPLQWYSFSFQVPLRKLLPMPWMYHISGWKWNPQYCCVYSLRFGKARVFFHIIRFMNKSHMLLAVYRLVKSIVLFLVTQPWTHYFTPIHKVFYRNGALIVTTSKTVNKSN